MSTSQCSPEWCSWLAAELTTMLNCFGSVVGAEAYRAQGLQGWCGDPGGVAVGVLRCL